METGQAESVQKFTGKRICSYVSCMILCICCTALSAADSWVLAAQKFTYTQVKSAADDGVSVATVIPQLLLEQLASGSVRSLPEEEVRNRKLDTLQTARLSLFLQLSKEFQARDALVLSKISPRELEKAIAAENKKITALQKQIADNLAESDAAAQPQPSSNNAVVSRPSLPFSIPFFHRETQTVTESNPVSLYKDDPGVLFEPTAQAGVAGPQSRIFDREVVAAKINGLITGSIVTYGDYAAVTVKLTVYPGGIESGAITEVGLIDDPVSLSREIVRRLTPEIANSLPVVLHFDIQPEEAVPHAVVTVDGFVYSTVPDSVVVNAGIHTISIESENFALASATYEFSNDTRFTIRAVLNRADAGMAHIRLKKYREGIFYADGTDLPAADTATGETVVTVNGNAVLGRFSAAGSDTGVGAFYYIPSAAAVDGAHLVIDAVPYDRAANIDKRRRSMYTAYSALICTLPLTFYCAGNYTSAANGYSRSRVSYEDAVTWERRCYGAAGLSIGCGVWFVFELARYLHAANDVLPAMAKSDSSGKNSGR